MKRLVVLYEDHSAQHLRPLAWSLPAYEIPCGLFNLRERLEIAAPRAQLGFLPRGLLTDLQAASMPGAPVGPEALAAAARASDEVLLLSARLAGSSADLAALIETLPADRPLGDAGGLLAWRLAADAAPAVLEHWRDWEAAAAAAGAWTRDGVHAEPWQPVDWSETDAPAARRHLWDLVPDIGPCIERDLAALAEGDTAVVPARRIFGALDASGAPRELPPSTLRRVDPGTLPGVHVAGEGELWLAGEAAIAPGAAVDPGHGPIVLEAGARVLPHAYLEGPLHLGARVRVKAGAQLYGETAVGAHSRVNGEIAETQLCAYANKQHAGFLGHAVVGSWTNLGADTTNSDLKNNYGEISVNYGLGAVATGSRFVGLMLGEHAKSAIGTTFNTGTTVGFSSNVFGAGFPRSCLRNYTWGDGRGRRLYQAERAIEVAEVVMARRDCVCTPAHAALFRALSDPGA